MPRNVRILAVKAMVIAMLAGFASPAQALDDLAVLRDLAQSHCEQLRRAPLSPQPRLKQRVELLNESPDNPAPLLNAYENAPDFGFLLPKYWPVMSWAQRVRFNAAMAALVKKRMHLPAGRPEETECTPQIRNMEQPPEDEGEQDEDAQAEKTQPTLRSLQAIALMSLYDTRHKETPLTYLFSRQPSQGWQMDDLLIHTRSVKDQDGPQLEKIIAQHGIDRLEAYLENAVKAH